MCTSMESVESIFQFSLLIFEIFRSKNVEKSAAYNKTFKGNEDGKVNSSGPRQVVSQNGTGPASGYIQK